MRVDVWSDIACPWCWVGKRRLEAALRAFEHRDAVDVLWHAFELHPGAPKQHADGLDYTERLARKYRTDRAGAQAMLDQMTNSAAADGLTMRFYRIKPGNTFDCHRLIHLAHTLGKQDAMKERLFAAYLEEGEPISLPATLSRLGVEVGLDATEVDAMLEGDAYTDDVREDERTAEQLGVHGVPFFVVGHKFGFSGAQPAETILTVLERAWSEREPALEAVSEGSACGPAGCS